MVLVKNMAWIQRWRIRSRPGVGWVEKIDHSPRTILYTQSLGWYQICSFSNALMRAVNRVFLLREICRLATYPRLILDVVVL